MLWQNVRLVIFGVNSGKLEEPLRLKPKVPLGVTRCFRNAHAVS